MSAQLPIDVLEERLRVAGRALAYPPTPDLAGSVRQRLAQGFAAETRTAAPARIARRRLTWAVAALLVVMLAGGALFVPQVQAVFQSIFRLGAVTVHVVTPTPLLTGLTPTITPTAAATPSSWLNSMVGETTLEAAQKEVSFTIKLPTYPPALGKPDRVFVQDLGGKAVVLAWLQPGSRDQVKMSLHILDGRVSGGNSVDLGGLAKKEAMQGEVSWVNGPRGQWSLWVRGPHMLEYYGASGNVVRQLSRMVDGNVLIWVEGGITYRLESALNLEEAIKVAESVR